eukprot:m.294003 g.294003  ORF g.294003 m.294003 type:complete len:104 (+) comp36321_c0_seq1:3-314(+)
MVLLHIVGLKFNDGITEETIKHHFEEEVALKKRMPDLVLDWHWGRNVSEHTRGDVNHGMRYVVVVTLKDKAALEAYLPHPEHIQVKDIQGPMVHSITVLDIEY